MMRLLDTVVIVGALNPDDDHHGKASTYLDRLRRAPAVHIPDSTLFEFDLLMKARGYTEAERETTWLELSPKIPRKKIVNISPTVLAAASELQAEGMGYFDSLITALALELRASVITDDRAIAARVKAEW